MIAAVKDVTVSELQQYAAEAYKTHEASWQPGSNGQHGGYKVTLREAIAGVMKTHHLPEITQYLIWHMCEFPSDYIEHLL